MIATGVPKPATPSSSAPKQKPITTRIDAAVVGQMLDRPAAEGVEAAGGDGDVVEQQRVEHDPHHRPEREHHAVDHGIEREVRPAYARGRRR